MSYTDQHLRRGPDGSVHSSFFYNIHCGTMSIDAGKYLARLTDQDIPGHHITPSGAAAILKMMP